MKCDESVRNMRSVLTECEKGGGGEECQGVTGSKERLSFSHCAHIELTNSFGAMDVFLMGSVLQAMQHTRGVW